MSMLQQLVAAVSAAERQIDDQIRQLTTYVNELDNVTRNINSALSGSTQDYERQMLQQMSATKAEVTQAIGRLQTAKSMLARVRRI